MVLADRLAREHLTVRVVSRHRPAVMPVDVDWCGADVTDPASAAHVAEGATVVYQCLNAPYTGWPELFPPLQRNVLDAAARAGALLVTLENVYAYGPTHGRAMTEDLPLSATTSKGRARAAMTEELLAAHRDGHVRVAIGRASDFFGPGVTASTLGDRVFGRAVAGRRADFLGDPGLEHTYSYVPDVAAGLATLGTDDRAIGQTWHLPGPGTVTTRAILDLVSAQLGHPVGVRGLPRPVRRAFALVNPMMRELDEMAYQFESPFVLDTSKFTAVFGPRPTPLPEAVTETVDWYGARAAAA
jgi:nucleoside-diphosphate-sugar epimerase